MRIPTTTAGTERARPAPRDIAPLILLLVALFAGSPGAHSQTAESLVYPGAERVDHVDVYHGREVHDPYRWLEDLDSPATRRFMKAQDDLARAQLAGARQTHFATRLEALWGLETFGTPRRAGGFYLYTRTAPGRSQAVLLAQRGRDGEARPLVDPNTDRELAGRQLAGFVPSPDGRHVAFGTARIGSRWAVWGVVERATGRRSALRLTGLNRPSVVWAEDGSGFFYTRQQNVPDESEEDTQSVVLGGESVFFHRLGTGAGDDRLVYERVEEGSEWIYGLKVSEDGRWLVLSERRPGDTKNRLLALDLERDGARVQPLAGDGSSSWVALGDGVDRRRPGGATPELFCWTDDGAPRGRIVAVPLGAGGSDAVRTVVAEGSDALRGANLIDDRLLLIYSRDALTEVEVHALDGSRERTVELPSVAYLGGFAGKPSDRLAYYSLSGLTDPGTVYELDPRTGESVIFRRGELPFSPEDFVTEQVFYESRDGTRVPMFIARRTDVARRAKTPLILYGYGAWGWSAVPWFQPGTLAWMEAGGVYALANVRGGGEYGETWHQAGIVQRKQNSIDDLLAAAEWLVENEYTLAGRLAVRGGSASGPLVGAAITQRPELFGAALINIPALDMLRLEAFTGGRGWIPEFGSVEKPDEFAALHAYSPYHRVEPEACYPSTLLTAGERDETTVPSHAYKFAAALQHAQRCDRPVLLQIAWGAGHSFGANREESTQTMARQLAFASSALGLGASPGGGLRAATGSATLAADGPSSGE